MDALETYLRELAAIRPVAVKETSYYPALSNPFNDSGREVTQMARRIAAILLLSPALDANYAAVTGQA